MECRTGREFRKHPIFIGGNYMGEIPDETLNKIHKVISSPGYCRC